MTGVSDFFDSDILDQKPSGHSVLAERYLRAGIPIIGGEQICEIILDDYLDRFWACRVCNVADSTLETADTHIHSREHVLASFKAYKIYDAYKAEIDSSAESEHWSIEYKHLIEHLRQVGILQPLAYCLTNSPNEFAKTLGVSLSKKDSLDVVEEITDTINIIHCNGCVDVYFADVNKEKAMQAKFDHCATVNHQRCIYINSFMKSLNLIKQDELPACVNIKEEGDLLVSAEDNIAYGVPLGFQHCIAFGGQSEYFCNICYCLVRCEAVQDHFSSEAHIERFLRSKTPSNYVNIEYETLEKRRSKLESELAGNFKDMIVYHHWEAKIATPTLLRQIVCPEKRSLKVTPFGTLPPNILLCDICNSCFSSRQQSWEDHVFDDQHFEKLVAKQRVERDSRSFIFETSDLPQIQRQKKAHWNDQDKIHNVQNYGEFGLDLIFRDVVACQYICSCCYESFPQEDTASVIFHARSLSHIKAALCLVNPVFAAKLLTTRNEVELKAMVLDYLQNRAAPIFQLKMRVFDPTTAYILNSQVKIPRILLRLSLADPNARDDIIADYGIPNENGEITILDDSDYLCLTTALETTNLLLTRIDSKVVVFWCNDCHTSFSAFQRDLKSIWTDHMLTDLHWQRTNLLKQNELGLNCLLDGTSQYQPTLFDQSGLKKKIPWHWNNEKNCFQFVLNNKLHMLDVFQQYNFHGSNRIFCSLCCDVVELSEDALTTHVRSLKHLIFYMHKYYSHDVVQLEDTLADNAKEIIVARLITRDLIADKLRVSETKTSRVLIFDARGSECQFPAIQHIVDDENRLIKLGMVKVVAKINALQSTNSFSIASLHNLPTPKPHKMNIKQQVLLHLVLKNVLSENFPDKRPTTSEDLSKLIPTTKPKTLLPNGPVASRVKLGFDGHIAVQLSSGVAPVPAPVGAPTPVAAPVQIPIRIDEPTPMDISDDDDEEQQKRSSRRRSRDRSLTYSDDERYDSSWRGKGSRRSRSPLKSSRMRSDDSREISRNNKHSWRDHERSSRREDRDDSYKQRGRSPLLRTRSPYRSPPPKSSRFENERSQSRRSPPPPSRRQKSPRRSPQRERYYEYESPPAPRYAEEEDQRSHSTSLRNQWMDTEEYSNHSRPEVVNTEEEMYRQFRLANPSPIPDFQQPPQFMADVNNGIQSNDLQNNPKSNDPKYLQIIRNLPVITPQTTILPTIDLTKPPPPLPQHIRPVGGYGASPMGMPQQFHQPPPMMGHAGFPPQGGPPFGMAPPPQPIDQAELVKKAKMELYNRDLIKINSRGALVEYLMKQSNDPIPSSDPPLLFNEVLKTKNAIIGADQLAQVICYGEPDYESFLCIMCQYWTSASDMFKHLKDETHRLNYMNKSYKLQHAKIIVEDKREKRESMLHEFSLKIAKCEGSKLCGIRMRTIMNSNAILKIWPEFTDHVDNSWKLGDEDEEIPPSNGSNKPVDTRRRSPSPKSRDRQTSSRNPREAERSSDRKRRDEDDRRRRSRSPRDSSRSTRDSRRRSKSPRSSTASRRQKSPEDNRPMWEKQAERFRKEMELISNNPSIDYDDISRAESERITSSLKSLAPRADQRNEAFEEEYDRQLNESYEREVEPEPPIISAAEKRRLEQEAEKNKVKEFQRYVSALILIRQEAMDNRGVDRDAVERICKEAGVEPDSLFSDEVLEDAAKRIGSDSIYTLMAIAHHYHNPSEPPPKILQETAESARPPHAATLLAQIGLDKSSIANLLRKVAMSKMKLTEEPEESEEKKARRGKRGGVKQKLKEMQAKVRQLQAANGGYDYPAGYYGGGPGYEEYGHRPPPASGAGGYYQDEYFYGGEEAGIPPRYNHIDYDYPRSNSANSNISARTPGYPAGYPAPVPRGPPPSARPPPAMPYGYSNDPDIEWSAPPPRPKQTKTATGGNTIPLGPPRKPGYGAPATRIPASAAAPSTSSHRPPYDASQYDYQGYPPHHPTIPSSSQRQQPPPLQEPQAEPYINGWDDADSALQNLFS